MLDAYPLVAIGLVLHQAYGSLIQSRGWYTKLSINASWAKQPEVTFLSGFLFYTRL